MDGNPLPPNISYTGYTPWSPENKNIQKCLQPDLGHSSHSSNIMQLGDGISKIEALSHHGSRLISPSLQPNAVSLNAALSALGSQWQKALRLGEAAESSRLDVDAAGYDTLLAVCNQSGSWKEAHFFVLFLYRGLHHGKKTCDFACLVQCSISNSFPLMALMLLNLETPQKPLV